MEVKKKSGGKKKLFEIFGRKKIDFFVEFLTENFFQSLLKGCETTIEKYRVFFEIL